MTIARLIIGFHVHWHGAHLCAFSPPLLSRSYARLDREGRSTIAAACCEWGTLSTPVTEHCRFLASNWAWQLLASRRHTFLLLPHAALPLKWYPGQPVPVIQFAAYILFVLVASWATNVHQCWCRSDGSCLMWATIYLYATDNKSRHENLNFQNLLR